MYEPILVVMAAGLGSRYGGLKQMDPIGDGGEWLIDFSLYDAYQAGFRQVVFIVGANILEDFKETIGQRIAGKMTASYVVQRLDDLPGGNRPPVERTRPWGTGHAIFSGRSAIGEHPFMAINADDYYGPLAFKELYLRLKEPQKVGGNPVHYMVGYQLKNTVTPHGQVSRGICSVDEKGQLSQITERTHIEKCGEEICFTEDGGTSWTSLLGETPVSLNCWGFHPSLLGEMEGQFTRFLEKALVENPLGAEYYLPSAVEDLIKGRRATVEVVPSQDRWYGVTFAEDKALVGTALTEMKQAGIYPQDLWNA